MLKRRPVSYALTHLFFLLASLCLYYLLAYETKRFETLQLLSLYSGLFLIYFLICHRTAEEDITYWLFASIVFRVVLIFPVPNLSDDFYRFIWDGNLLHAGYHPFAEVPSYYIDNGLQISGITPTLYNRLNSKDYFTIYPPLSQLVFFLATSFEGNAVYNSMMVMKVLICGAEIGTLILLRNLLQKFTLPSGRILLYALNPLVIIELTGNIHFEAFLIFFLLLTVTLIHTQKLFVSGISFAAAICVKLIPLIFLPVMLTRLNRKANFIFSGVAALFTVLFFLPLYDEQIVSGFVESIGYYFRKFEFNASIYYVVRAWGYSFYGYNIIQTVGWKLGLIATALILFYSCSRAKFSDSQSPATEKAMAALLPADWMWILLIYFLFTTTLHPWYITTLLALSVFTSYNFVMVWTALIFLTYAGYSETGFVENLWLTALEYVIMIGYLGVELYRERIQIQLR